MDYAEAHPRPANDNFERGMDDTYPSTSAQIIPITQERTDMTHFNPDDADAVSRFFQGIANKVVLASTLPKEVEELRTAVDALKKDVEQYREHMARADEEITNLRRERQALQDENAQLRAAGDREHTDHMLAQERWGQACQERDRWHNDYIQLAEANETAKRERDDAQMRIMELERDLRDMTSDRDIAQCHCDEVISKLNSIRSALA